MKVIIMAGGKGTRISSINKDIPKPMLPLAGKPVLEREIESLKEQGLTEILIITGHLGNCISDYFEDGSSFGVHISYYHEKMPLGTAGALFELKEELKNEKEFLLINGDIIFDIDFRRFIRYHELRQSLVTLLTHPNNHPYDSAIIKTASSGMVIQWINKEDDRDIYKNRVNAGIHILSSKILDMFDFKGKVDLDRDILKPLVEKECMYAYDSSEYVKDMGTPERYKKIEDDYIVGKIKSRNLKRKQKAIFLDRDGTINKYKGFIKKSEDIELLSGVSDAIRKFNEAGFLVVIITNQPVIARGECSLDELNKMHMRIETLLGRDGAYIDSLYFCPHHPDKGFEGEVQELKINCDCRKPRSGLLLKAADDLNIDLFSSFMIGDSQSDVLAGRAAGCKTGLILNGEIDDSFQVDYIGSTLLDIAKMLEKESLIC